MRGVRPLTHPRVPRLLLLPGLLLPALLTAQATTAPERATLTQSDALAGIDFVLTLERGPAGVTGHATIYVSSANRATIEAAYGCHADRPSGRGGEEWICEVIAPSSAPRWAATWAALDSLTAAGIPNDSLWRREAGLPAGRCLDGTPWEWRRTLADGSAELERQSCGSMSPAREAFEKQVEQVIAQGWKGLARPRSQRSN
jgi:hypothetical protein